MAAAKTKARGGEPRAFLKVWPPQPGTAGSEPDRGGVLNLPSRPILIGRWHRSCRLSSYLAGVVAVVMRIDTVLWDVTLCLNIFGTMLKGVRQNWSTDNHGPHGSVSGWTEAVNNTGVHTYEKSESWHNAVCVMRNFQRIPVISRVTRLARGVGVRSSQLWRALPVVWPTPLCRRSLV
jgi:hypothetical protein